MIRPRLDPRVQFLPQMRPLSNHRMAQAPSLSHHCRQHQALPRVVAAARRHKAATGSVLLIGLIVAAAAAYGIYALLHHQANAPFPTFAITQLTNTRGKVQETAISPDGRFLLSVQSDNGNESLWLRNIPTGSDTQVLPASGQSFASLVFSPDGNSFYFRETAGGAAGV